MIRYKKTILTLVALIAVTTGAWAEETPLVTITFDSNGPVYSVEGLVTLTGTNYNTGSSSGVYYWSPNSPSKTLSATVEAVADKVSISKVVFWGLDADYAYPLEDTEKPFVCYSNYDHGGRSLSETDWTNIKSSERIAKIDVYAASSASAVTVDWNKTSKTGTFTMPGGNVTLEPEYYPQAALTAAPTAINDVPATTDGAIVKVGTVANIGSTTTAQGTVMYYVSPTALDDAALLALAADAWTADMPTAESLAQGQAYVYYYVRGNDSDTDEENFSDGDILAANALTVTIAAAPTYAVTFADDTAEPTLWTASPAADVKKGQTVTVTYSGSKKVIGVKAEKKAKGNIVDLSTLTEAYEAQTLDILTGTTSQLITIAAGATVTLKDATVNNQITCSGDATIILADGSTNTVTVSANGLAGIQIGAAGTLTINGETAGDGKLTVQGGSDGAGIGTTVDEKGGNIVINGGRVTATGGDHAAGIGTGNADSDTNECGSITINGGTVTAKGVNGAAGIGTGVANYGTNTCGAITINGGTVTATGGGSAAGIGTGYAFNAKNECDAITIGTGVTSVTATKGTSSPNSIGKGDGEEGTQTCGTITIGGVVKDQSEFTGATYTYPPSN